MLCQVAYSELVPCSETPKMQAVYDWRLRSGRGTAGSHSNCHCPARPALTPRSLGSQRLRLRSSTTSHSRSQLRLRVAEDAVSPASGAEQDLVSTDSVEPAPMVGTQWEADAFITSQGPVQEVVEDEANVSTINPASLSMASHASV